MKKLILAILLFIAAVAYIIITGGTYEAEYQLYYYEKDISEIRCEIPSGSEVISVDGLRLEENAIRYTVKALSYGKAEVHIYTSDDVCHVNYFYVHKLGFITEDSWLGRCTGGNVLIVLLLAYSIMLLEIFIKKFKDGLKRAYYSYHNIALFAIILILVLTIIYNAFSVFGSNGLVDFVTGILYTSHSHLIVTIPLAFITAILVIISNIVLIRKEGLKRKNVIGTFFAFCFLFSLFIPAILGYYLQVQTWLDVHRESSIGNYIEIVIDNYSYALITYVVVILESSIVIGIRAAYRIPAFDKDYIIILGCAMRKDGTPTPLLKGRVDAAVRFAKLQKEATNKDIIFVPSGGQGKNEIISEAECMKNYLISLGIEENSILPEDKSSNTYENFVFSSNKIKEKIGNVPQTEADGLEENTGPKIAFATTSYHVFRSGFIASRNAIKAEGIGSKTKKYFWINAFIRELMATMHYERKQHFIFAGILFVAVAFMGGLVFLSRNI